MTAAYATVAELTEFTGTQAPAQAIRLLTRASEVLDDHVITRYDVDTDGLPTDSDTAAALRDAACAQVEYWAEVGEDHDIGSLFNRAAGLGHLSLGALPPELGARPRRILAVAGLLNPATGLSVADQFFTSEAG